MSPNDAALAPDMTCEAALALLIDACAVDIDHHMASFMQTPSPEGPHKARVALRRLTTALDAFAPLLKRAEAQRLRHRAKAIFRRLGAVRDADVYLEGRGKAARTADLQAEVALLREATRRHLRARDAVAFGPLLQRKLAEAALFRTSAKGRAARLAPVSALAVTALDAARLACRKRGADLSRLDDIQRHEFRKDMKTLRYLSEFFAPLWPGAITDDAQDALAELQDALGTLNDMANARHRDGKSRRADALEKTALKRAVQLWSRLDGRRPWWQQPGRPGGSPRPA